MMGDHAVWSIITNVLENIAASIFKAESTLFSLKMKAAFSCEIVLMSQQTWCHIPEDSKCREPQIMGFK
jgi:hypothetical protein